MEHTAYRQIRSLFGIASTPNTDFGSITPKNAVIVVIGLRVYGNTIQHIAKFGQYLGFHRSQILVSIWD